MAGEVPACHVLLLWSGQRVQVGGVRVGEHQQRCPWCRSGHGRRFLCDGAAAALEEVARRGRSGTMPTVTLDEPIQMMPDPSVDTLVAQLVVKAGMIPGPGGVYHPAIVLTGQTADRTRLPQWVYAAEDESLRRVAPLMRDMTELAIRQADARNRSR